MARSDWILLTALTAVYAIAAFVRPGETSAPRTFWYASPGTETIAVDLGRTVGVSKLVLYNGAPHGNYEIGVSADGVTWSRGSVWSEDNLHVYVFRWSEYPVEASTRYIEIRASQPGMRLGEMGIFEDTSEGPQLILIPELEGVSLTPGGSGFPNAAWALFDEPDTLRETYSYENSTYFDEIYHARTAYEFIHDLYPYENTHPPLGKLILSLGIRIFGMTPFGWRFMGIFFGILMVPVFYVLAKWVLRHTPAAAGAAAVFTFDFMHLTQTRIATIDTYAVFFILLMYLFMWGYMTCPLYAPLKKTLPWLFLSGLSFGLGAASKWVCLYAGVGLAVLYSFTLFARWKYTREHVIPGRRSSKVDVSAADSTHNPLELPESFRPFLLNTLVFSVLFFVVVPAIVYSLSYIPFARGVLGEEPLTLLSLLREAWRNQPGMFHYHSKYVLGSTHPYSSPWWMWLLDIRPILYYMDIGAETRSVFASFNNPLLSWGGLCVLVPLFTLALRRRVTALFTMVGYLSQILPWVLVSRLTFSYHYFPSVIFLALGLGVAFREIWEETPKRRWIVPVYAGACALLFSVFYPSLTGLPMTAWYSRNILNWFPSWPI